jgi:hypothetical protein
MVSELFNALAVKIWYREISVGGITETITCYFVIMIWRIGFKLAVCIEVKIGKCCIWAGKGKIIRWLSPSNTLINNVTEIVC